VTVSTGALHSLIVVFSWLALASTLAVLVGLYLETHIKRRDVEYPMREKRGEIWVLLGVIGEFGFGVIVFILASTVDTRQRLEIAGLETKLIEVAPRSELLYGESRKNLVVSLKKPQFAGQKVEIRFCDVSFNRYFIDSDTLTLAGRLHDVLQEAGWSADFPDRKGCNGTGVWVQVDPNASAQTRKAAAYLVASLKSLPMVADLTADLTGPSGEPPKDVNAVVVTVEAHPI
jgi:hypothetical protein